MNRTSYGVTRNYHGKPDGFESQSRIHGIFRVLRFGSSFKSYGAAT